MKKWNGKLNKRGDTRGCIVKHGMAGTRVYNIWGDMKKRCNNPKNKRYSQYGGRGIQVCDEWLNDFQAFYDWAMENGYRDDLTIDRIEVNGNYESSNCRWVDMKTQQRNTTRNHFVEAFGQKKTIAEWAEIYGISPDVIKDRINKLHWNGEDAVSIKTLPIGGKRKHD